MTAASLMGGLIFSGVGLVAFTYGKRTGGVRATALGGVLMVYSFFTPNTAALYLVGLGLTAALFIFRD
jgi:hypothetical protein